MKNANRDSKNLVVDILSKSFDKNLSVNYIAKQDSKRKARIRSLMDYSFEMCYLFGNVYLSDDEKACALVLYPRKKKDNLRTVFLDVKLIFKCIGIRHIIKVLSREATIKKVQPKEDIVYLWFIGTDPSAQNIGIGSKLIRSVIDITCREGKPIYLETSTTKNLPWYQKLGFEIYAEKNLGYNLFFLRKLFVP